MILFLSLGIDFVSI